MNHQPYNTKLVRMDYLIHAKSRNKTIFTSTILIAEIFRG